MRNLRTKFERFCYKNRDKGIPNLMLYIVVVSAVVYIIGMFNGGEGLYELLRFDKSAILRGQVWRLVTHVLTYSPSSSPYLILIGFYFFYHLARGVEMSMGTFKFNLFYLTGVALMDVFAMIFCPVTDVTIAGIVLPAETISYAIYSSMGWYLHLSLLLMFASTNPDGQFLVFFFIPVRAWFLGLVYIIFAAVDIYNMSVPISFFPHNLFPLVGLMNYLLFVGKDVLNLFPFLPKFRRKPAAAKAKPAASGPIPFRTTRPAPQKADFNHKCTVCGRTDVTNPELEFRYCSRCSGYRCYCSEHINNHTHV